MVRHYAIDYLAGDRCVHIRALRFGAVAPLRSSDRFLDLDGLRSKDRVFAGSPHGAGGSGLANARSSSHNCIH